MMNKSVKTHHTVIDNHSLNNRSIKDNTSVVNKD
jgi:hypothetical protein